MTHISHIWFIVFCSSCPIFGVEFETDDRQQSLEELTVEPVQDDVEIETSEDQSDAFAVSYFP